MATNHVAKKFLRLFPRMAERLDMSHYRMNPTKKSDFFAKCDIFKVVTIIAFDGLKISPDR